jgi:hypothetical protein
MSSEQQDSPKFVDALKVKKKNNSSEKERALKKKELY